MTLKEEAYAIIDKLPDKVMEDIVQMLKRTEENPRTWETPEQERERKMRAFQRMEELRKTNPLQIPEDYEAEYEDAVLEKYRKATA